LFCFDVEHGRGSEPSWQPVHEAVLIVPAPIRSAHGGTGNGKPVRAVQYEATRRIAARLRSTSASVLAQDDTLMRIAA
jgi:hypothetical protein